MASPRFSATPALFPTPRATGFIAATGTAAKILVEPLAAAAEVTTAPPSPPFYGGGTVFDLSVSSTDSVAKSMLVYRGVVLTTVGTDTGTTTLSAQNAITRTTGDFIADGWRIGDQVMVFAPSNGSQVAAAIDGIAGTITTLTTAVLTVNGTPWAAGSNVLTTGSRIVNVTQFLRAAIPANAGNSDTILPVAVISNTLSAAIWEQEVKLGPSTMLIGSMVAAVSALPAVVSVTASVARY